MLYEVITGKFVAGTYSYGLKENAVDYAKTGNLIPADVIKYAEMLRGKILDGSIMPPGTYDQLDAFTPPSL